MHSHLQRKKTHTHLPLTGHFVFFGPSCLNPRGGPHGKIHSDARLELQQTPSFRSWPLRALCPKSARKQSSRRSRSREPVIRPNYQREMKRDLEPFIFRLCQFVLPSQLVFVVFYDVWRNVCTLWEYKKTPNVATADKSRERSVHSIRIYPSKAFPHPIKCSKSRNHLKRETGIQEVLSYLFHFHTAS